MAAERVRNARCLRGMREKHSKRQRKPPPAGSQRRNSQPAPHAPIGESLRNGSNHDCSTETKHGPARRSLPHPPSHAACSTHEEPAQSPPARRAQARPPARRSAEISQSNVACQSKPNLTPELGEYMHDCHAHATPPPAQEETRADCRPRRAPVTRVFRGQGWSAAWRSESSAATQRRSKASARA